MSEIHFIDTTLRDGQQSLWALNMRTSAMLGIAEQMDKCGYESIEFFLSMMFKKYAREHKENAWEWLRQGTKLFKRTRLRYHGGMHGGFEKIPTCIMRLLMERVLSYGITLTRTSNCWNDYSLFKHEVDAMRRLGIDCVANLIYSVSPRHTDEYYAERARQAAAMKPYRVCFKDVGGLLTPERARALIPIVQKNVGAVPLEFHAHCNNSLAPLNYMEAIKLGLTTLHTGIPPLANGSAQPSVLTVAKNARALGHTPLINEADVGPVTEHFTAVARRDGLPVGKPTEYDENLYRHQVPGGMISNLKHQLKLVGMQDKIDATLEEAARVRAEFGYPIMVTPLSQFVGSQAAINVITGERYCEVTDQTIQYALGIWGKEGAELMDPQVKDKILSRPRAKKWDNWKAPDPSLKEMREKFGGPGVSDEELILRFYAGPDAADEVLKAGAPQAKLDANQPLTKLVQELSARDDLTYVRVEKAGFAVTLGKEQ